MSVVLGGYGLGCLVTRGYGCPTPLIPTGPVEICELPSVAALHAFLISPAMQSTMLMTFVTGNVEVLSMVSVMCDLQSSIMDVVNLISSLSPPAEVELQSYITLIINLDSPAVCGGR